MHNTYESVHKTNIDGFDIDLSIMPEDTPIDWDFESEEEKQHQQTY